MVESSKKVGPWREAVVAACLREDLTGAAFAGPVRVSCTFYLTRPQGHRNARGELKPSAPRYPATTPDLDKIIRSTLDALTQAAVIQDDRLVVAIDAVKLYATPARPPGADLVITEES